MNNGSKVETGRIGRDPQPGDNPLRCTVCFHRMGPYHLARLRAAYRELPGLTAIEWSALDKTYAWAKEAKREEFPIRTIITYGDAEEIPAKRLRQRLDEEIGQAALDCLVVNGWGFRTAMVAMAWGLRRRVPLVVMSESTAWDNPTVGWREWVKRRLVRRYSAALVGGTPHRDYLQQLGMESGAIFEGYDAVDNFYFRQKAKELRDQITDSDQPKRQKYFLASARFVEKKNLFRLLEAYARYKSQFLVVRGRGSSAPSLQPWSLVLLGDGELKTQLIDRCRDLGLPVIKSAPLVSPLTSDLRSQMPGNVYLPGFIQYPDLPQFYALAEVFVHASTREQWGLVVNEAMASGLPVIVSKRCGCASDLVHEGVNGWTFDPLDPEALAQLMMRMSLLPPGQRSAMGHASARIISDWGPERFADGLRKAVEKALEIGPRKPSILDRWLLEILCHIR